MSRKVMSVVLVALVLIVCAPQAVTTPAWGDTIQLVSNTSIAYPYSGASYDLTAIATDAGDWAMSGVSEKAGGTIIETFGSGNTGYTWQTNYPDSGNPKFSFTNGDTAYGAAAQSDVVSAIRIGYGYVVADVAAGSGTLTVWSGSSAAETYYCYFDGQPAVSYTDTASSLHKVVFNYQTSTAQKLNWTAADGAGGIYAVAITPTPEPGTLVLVAAGVFGLVCYAWRKRN